MDKTFTDRVKHLHLSKLASLKPDDEHDIKTRATVALIYAGQNIPPFMRKTDMLKDPGQFRSYSPIAQCYMQWTRPGLWVDGRPTQKPDPKEYWPFGNAPCAYGTCYFFHDLTGAAFLWCGSGNGPDHGYHWYLFGCSHEYKHTAVLGNCYNRHTCTKCGHIDDVDSSD